MTLNQYCTINWQRGNVVRLDNGKEYVCKGVKQMGKWLLLYSEEYDAYFTADYRIVDCRVSDYAEPEEVYLKKKAERRAAAEAKMEAERQARRKAKEELKAQHLREQAEAHARKLERKQKHQQEQEVKKQAPAPQQAAPSTPEAAPKKKRPRIHTVRVVSEKVNVHSK